MKIKRYVPDILKIKDDIGKYKFIPRMNEDDCGKWVYWSDVDGLLISIENALLYLEDNALKADLKTQEIIEETIACIRQKIEFKKYGSAHKI